MKLKVFVLQSSRGRGESRAAGRWSFGSRDIGFRSAGSSRRNGAITSGRGRTLLRSFSVGVLSFLFIFARLRAFSILSVVLLLWLTDVPDEGLGLDKIHIAVGQLLATLDEF
jgi:hypothetical protein